MAAWAGAGAAGAGRVDGSQAMGDTLEKKLVGTWRHSHEEDTATESVYRPEGFEFPPARGRVGYTFGADRSCVYIGIAARDGSARETCTWALGKGTPPEIVVTLPGGRRDVLPVVSVDETRLVIRKPEA